MKTPWRMFTSVLLLALGGGAAYAQPFVFYRGIVNAASFAPPGLPNGSIAVRGGDRKNALSWRAWRKVPQGHVPQGYSHRVSRGADSLDHDESGRETR